LKISEFSKGYSGIILTYGASGHKFYLTYKILVFIL